VKERLVRNWERSEAISVGVKPAPSRRSKPCGAVVVAALSRLAAAPLPLLLVLVLVEASWVVFVVVWRARAASEVRAAEASAARSVGESASLREQWM